MPKLLVSVLVRLSNVNLLVQLVALNETGR
jgi:hypothetical protein